MWPWLRTGHAFRPRSGAASPAKRHQTAPVTWKALYKRAKGLAVDSYGFLYGFVWLARFPMDSYGFKRVSKVLYGFLMVSWNFPKVFYSLPWFSLRFLMVFYRFLWFPVVSHGIQWEHRHRNSSHWVFIWFPFILRLLVNLSNKRNSSSSDVGSVVFVATRVLKELQDSMAPN